MAKQPSFGFLGLLAIRPTAEMCLIFSGLPSHKLSQDLPSSGLPGLHLDSDPEELAKRGAASHLGPDTPRARARISVAMDPQEIHGPPKGVQLVPHRDPAVLRVKLQLLPFQAHGHTCGVGSDEVL